MFDYGLLHWVTFISAAILLNLAPGPDIAFIIGQTLKGGKRAGFFAMLGIWAGAFGHVVMAAIGLSAILVASGTLFTAVKWVGAVYLIWLGISALRSSGDTLAGEGISFEKSKLIPTHIFRQGVIVALLNPKVAIFFLAFLPQFVVEGAGPVWTQLFLHGSLIIVIAGFVEPPLILLGDRLAVYLKNNRKLGLWLDRSIGALFIALGAKLALSER